MLVLSAGELGWLLAIALLVVFVIAAMIGAYYYLSTNGDARDRNASKRLS